MRIEEVARDLTNRLRERSADSEEYAREAKGRPGPPEQRRAERIERLLAGEPLETSGLGYDFEGHHIGMVATGPGAAEALRELARALERSLLLVSPAEETVWAWLGGRQALSAQEALEWARQSEEQTFSALALGEPGEGIAAWRLTHRQARAALIVARRRDGDSIVRYADVALLAAVLQDDFFSTSLRRLYLEPLEADGDGGALLDTLVAYFTAERNVSSAAAALGVSRKTVNSRLRAIEGRLGRPLGDCAIELELSLRLLPCGFA